ncbi:alanine--tRNA ligase [Fibrobacterales bacterium]|nr:alanine--tRNA ligase [Fibrobacterales bacterium]
MSNSFVENGGEMSQPELTSAKALSLQKPNSWLSLGESPALINIPRTSAEIRDSFIRFFQGKNHLFVRSSPVVPQDDPTLMFINAGMNQFKACFLGDNPSGYVRVANSQKCIRVSGKHNDLDEVGRDTYHHTFFEMLGNWSFGDYYKKEAITWAWELLTEVWKLPKERLFVTVFRDDDEAAQIWKEVSKLPDNRIMRFGEKSNFWEMGETGPCGPCSEIHYDKGDIATQEATFSDPVAGVNGTNARYIEIWNNVFMQYERMKDGTLKELPKKNVDTGMGFERVCAILQGKESNYDTDVFTPIISKITELSGVPYTSGAEGMPHRVVADHLRALSFAIADGALPSNEGRGYVLRRILRRASRYARLLGQKEPFICKLIPTLSETMGEAFPEIRERADFVAEVIKAEEDRFIRTLDAGLERFEKIVGEISPSPSATIVIPGKDVFTLYDTYGFPPDLTRILAEEKGLEIDEVGFEAEMEKQKERARGAQKQGLSAIGSEGWTIFSEGSTEFLGYLQAQAEVKILRYKEDNDNTSNNGHISIVLNKTPFYAEMGGQVGERGTLSSQNGLLKLQVFDTVKVNDVWIHRAKVADGTLTVDAMSQEFTAQVNEDERAATRKNHSATHLLQAALRKVVGEHISQQGSRVSSELLRFDFTAFSALSPEQIREVENLVNEKIQECKPISTEELPIEKAKESGATALFGEKYGSVVRVVSVEDFSKEFCGGLHANNTGEIGVFRILSESSVSAGVRRIEAVTAFGAIAKYREESIIVSSLRDRLRAAAEQIPERLEQLFQDSKKQEKLVAMLRQQIAAAKAGELFHKAMEINGIKVWTMQTKIANEEFSTLVEGAQSQISEGVAVLANVEENSGTIAVIVHSALVQKGVKAGDIVKKLAEIAGGKGGGRPNFAQAGTKTPEKIKDAFAAINSVIEGI